MVRRSDNLSDKKGGSGLFSWFTSNIKKAARNVGVFLLRFGNDEETKKPKEDKPSDVDNLPEPPKPQPTPEPVPEVPQDPGEPFEIITDDIEDEPYEIGIDEPSIDDEFLDQLRQMVKDAGIEMNEEDLYDLAGRLQNETDVNPYGSPNDGNTDDPLDAITTELKHTELNNIRRKTNTEMLGYVEQMEEAAGTYTEYAAPSARVNSVSLKGKKYGADLLDL
jgi:hypothetical protein